MINESPLLHAMDESMKTKSIHWSYEEEVRMILHSTSFVEEEASEITFKPESVKRIILGLAASQDTQDRIVALTRGQDFSHVNLGQARIHPTEYKLVIGKL